MRALLVSGGRPVDKKIILKYIKNSYIVCADYGVKNFIDLDIEPDLVIGDLDSADRECLDYIKNKNINTLKLNCKKDYTDTEFAIDYLIDKGYDEIILLAATGTRLDHTLANIFVLERLFNKAKVKIIDNNNEIIYAEKGEYFLEKNDYKYLSILALSDEIKVSSKGLIYEVNHSNIKRSSSLGVSNEILENEAEIIIHDGKALIIKSKD
jgi:thiamine pyrophosphokinase